MGISSLLTAMDLRRGPARRWLAALGAVWITMRLSGPLTAAPSPASTADLLMQKLAAAAMAAQTLTADFSGTQQFTGPTGASHALQQAGSLRLKKPNLARVDFTRHPLTRTVASDGKSIVALDRQNRYTQQPADPTGKKIDAPWVLLVNVFFTGHLPDWIEHMAGLTRRSLGQRTVDGAPCDVVELEGQNPNPAVKGPLTVTLYIDSEGQLRRYEAVGPGPGASKYRQEMTFTNLQVGAPLADAGFAYSPPSGATLIQPVTESERQAYRREAETKLLALGQPAPDFNLQTPTGGHLSLRQMRRGKKAVLINFWYNGCPPCQMEFPRLDRLYGQLKGSGFGMVAINGVDDAALIRKWRAGTGYSFPVALAGGNDLLRRYRVTGFPTSYLVGPDGTIVWRWPGMIDEAALRAALEKQGIESARAALPS